MIRLIQRRLIIPRGDTGSFSIPVLRNSADNIAVFTIFDEVTHTKMFQKMVPSEGDVISIAFTHSDTVNLKPGKYVWDIKYYSNPEYIDDELVNGEEIDSYYAGFSLPVCEIRETADNYLVSPEAPTATLSPQQLEIVTGAIHSLNEAIRKTQENVEHYPEIRDEVWYTWDAELGDYVSTGVRANGIVGNGIESAVLNNDYTLTLNFTDGTSFTSPSIQGETGNGIDDIVLNNDFTLTISYTDGGSYTTPSIRGPVGATPQFSIGTVQEGSQAAASISGTAENPVLNLTLPNANVPTRVSELENDAGYLSDVQVNGTSIVDNNTANIPLASSSAPGVIQVGSGSPLQIQYGYLGLLGANSNRIKTGTDSLYPIMPNKEHEATFYGLAKVAGDTTQSQSANAVGTYTNEAKAAIQQMLDVPSNEGMNTAIGTAIGNINSFDMVVVQTLPTQDINTHTIYLVPKTGETNDIYDEYVYINNNWEMVGNTQIDLSNYVQKTDYATGNDAGLVKTGPTLGIRIGVNGAINIETASDVNIKSGSGIYKPITPSNQDKAMFYGLAKAAGDSTQSASENAVGTYTDEAKAAIQQMLDVPSINDIPVESSTGVGSVKTKDFVDNDITYTTTASGVGSFAEGGNTRALSMFTHAEGQNTEASGVGAHAEGGNAATASGMFAHAEGLGTTASKSASHAEGGETIASGNYSHAEGRNTTASGANSHAEGYGNTASGNAAHVEGRSNIASGQNSHVEGQSSIGTGMNSHTEGFYTIGHGQNVHVEGKFNVEDQLYPAWVSGTEYQVGDKIIGTNDFPYECTTANSDEEFDTTKWTGITNSSSYAHIVGNGEYDSRSNAYALDWDGNGYYMGDVYVGANADSSGGVKLATVEDIPDTSIYATKADTVLDSTLSRGRKTETTVGFGSFAFGYNVEASGAYSYANGYESSALGGNSHAIGNHTIATSASSLVSGQYNTIDNCNNYPEWEPNKAYFIGNKVKRTIIENNETIIQGYIAKKDSNRSSFRVTDWKEDLWLNYVDIVGNGIDNNNRSNAYALTWTGDGKYAGDVYVHANADSSGGTKLATVNDIPDVSVTDVQVAGVSILSNGIANVPVASTNDSGVVKVDSTYGLGMLNGYIRIVPASTDDIKAGTNNAKTDSVAKQHVSTFYGLSKVAGVDLANETVTLGTYPEASKTAIKAMLGIEEGLKVVRLI